MRKTVVPLLPAFLIVSCSDGATLQPALTNTAASLSMISGDAQGAEVGTELTNPLIVVASDSSGRPVKGVEVRFSGPGRAVRTHATTNADGRAWTYWELGTQAGPQAILAALVAPNGAPAVTFTAQAIAGTPARISLLSGTGLTGTPGTQLDTLNATVTDRFSNPAISATVNWSVLQGGGAVTRVNALTDVRGRARAVWTLGPTLGTQRVRLTSGAATGEFTAIASPIFAAIQVVAGSDHSCALVAGGAAYCWGSNWTGQLGRGYVDREANRFPLIVPGHRFKSLASGGVHTCGLELDGNAYCWGDNRAGQVGAVGSDPVASPTRVVDAPTFVALTAGWFHTCGLTSGGQMWCWGDNSLGQLGRGTDPSIAAPLYAFNNYRPALVAGSLHFTSISASPSATSTCGVADGIVYCWGESVEGVLGGQVPERCRVSAINEFTDVREEFDMPCRSTPLHVSTSAPAASVMLERYGACAVLVTTELECWGYRRSPTRIPGAHVANAWMLWSSVCGENQAGEVTCWWLSGSPPYNVTYPFGVTGALVNIHSSGRHSCGFVKATSALYCWGSNYDGALGDGTTIHRTYPVPVVSPP